MGFFLIHLPLALKLVLHLSKRLDSRPPTVLSHINISIERETLLSFKLLVRKQKMR